MSVKDGVQFMALDALISAIEEVQIQLAAYEAGGDHNHGRGSIPPGGPCGMGDECWVLTARAMIRAAKETPCGRSVLK